MSRRLTDGEIDRAIHSVSYEKRESLKNWISGSPELQVIAEAQHCLSEKETRQEVGKWLREKAISEQPITVKGVGEEYWIIVSTGEMDALLRGEMPESKEE